jgi:hypothetical protein
MNEMKALSAMTVVRPSTETDQDESWASFLLSNCSPVRARDFARAMAERTAWDVELDWHEHWERVAALLRDDSVSSRALASDAAAP